jgi:protein ImuA
LSASRTSSALDALRAEVAQIEAGERTSYPALPFGMPAMDKALPSGGLALGALHEVAGGGVGVVDAAAAALFSAGIVARLDGWVLWCLTTPDLFAPALAQAGLDPDRVIYVEAGSNDAVLACFEEGLRHGGLVAVVAEVARLPMTASRRLQLAAESTGTIGIAVRRWRRPAEAADFGSPTAAVTRWRITAVPSGPLPVPGISRARWLVELMRVRAGESSEWIVEGCDEEGYLGVPADLGDRPSVAQAWDRRAHA